MNIRSVSAGGLGKPSAKPVCKKLTRLIWHPGGHSHVSFDNSARTIFGLSALSFARAASASPTPGSPLLTAPFRPND
jgi:hypothetical protein